jgi:hypothetical protein
MKKKRAHGNTGNSNAAKLVQKQSLTIRLSPEAKEFALAYPGGASKYIESLIREDFPKYFKELANADER